MKKVGTLKELDVKPGDVVELVYNGILGSECKGEIETINEFGKQPYRDDYFGHKFRIVSQASDKQKLWRDMTNAEKGALLLAYHEGKVLEGRNESWPSDKWVEVRVPSWGG